jgi:cyclic-di-GMP phosphodiesterase TipF (flagellum assembly factor)
MSFLSSSVVVVAMAIVSVSLGALGFLAVRLDLDTAAILAIASFCLLIVLQFVAWRGQDRQTTSRGFEDLGRVIERLTRDVAMLANRVGAIEAAGAATAAKDVAALKRDVEAIRTHLDDVSAALSEQGAAVAGLVQSGVAQPTPGPPPEQSRKGRFAGLTKKESTALVAAAIDAGRIEILLQPIVTLPQRKIRWYQVHVHLKTERGEVMLADDFVPAAESGGLTARLDATILFRSVQLVRRLQARNRDIGIVVGISATTLAGGEGFSPVVEFLAANTVIAPSIVIEVPQTAYRRFGPIEFESLAAIARHGYRFSLADARDIRFDARELSDRAFRFVKVPANVLLGRAGALPTDLHPADLADLLARYGIDLVADRIEAEATVVDLLDFDVRFGQGVLFSPPRPVRADVLADIGAPPPERRAAAS